jgi:hypothetical protein
MRKSRHQDIRDVLTASEDGLTLLEIAVQLDWNYKAVQKSIKNAWGIYIDRWAVPKRGQFSAVYMCVPIPEDAPHPTERYLPQTKWQTDVQVGL